MGDRPSPVQLRVLEAARDGRLIWSAHRMRWVRQSPGSAGWSPVARSTWGVVRVERWIDDAGRLTESGRVVLEEATRDV